MKQEEIKRIRKKIFLTAFRGNTGHIASALSIVEILYVLLKKGVMKYRIHDPNWEERDRLVISKGHASIAMYVMLEEVGFISNSDLDSFCRPGSLLGGELKRGEVAGIEATTGSLGHGLSFAVGMALALKIDNKKQRVYCILGDGECEEGTVWEAVMSAAYYKLDNLTVILDNNQLQAMGSVEEIIGITDWGKKWEIFGWQVESIDGHNIEEIEEIVKKRNKKNKPRIIISNTVKGKGISFMEKEPIWHYRMPNQDELKIIMTELDISEEEIKECGQHI